METLDVSVKTRETATQETLGRRERANNLKGCFRITDRKAVSEKKLLLIDDAMTTGATANELALALKRAGAAKVYFLSVASVPCRNN